MRQDLKAALMKDGFTDEDILEGLLDYICQDNIEGLSPSENVLFRCTDLIRLVSVVQTEIFSAHEPEPKEELHVTC